MGSGFPFSLTLFDFLVLHSWIMIHFSFLTQLPSSPFKKQMGKLLAKIIKFSCNSIDLPSLCRVHLSLSFFFFFVWCWPSLIYAKKYNGHYQLFIRILTFDYLTFNKLSTKHNVFIYVNSLSIDGMILDYLSWINYLKNYSLTFENFQFILFLLRRLKKKINSHPFCLYLYDFKK